MSRREWMILLGVMVVLVAVGLVIVFAAGGGSGTPTQRTPSASLS